MTLALGANWTYVELFKLTDGTWQFTVTTAVGRFGDGLLYWTMNVYEAGVIATKWTAVTPVTGQWYCVEIKRDVANNLQELWVNGVSLVASNDAITNDTQDVRAGITWLTNASLNINFFDCVVAADQRIYCEVIQGMTILGTMTFMT